ncbi:Ig-like domain-containing protein [Gemmatimonas phototrophica]|uniref:Ig-like domain-containing protein n=1 Tax=Gemmatimonas phototrophica TaxID=1379270 RepID=UPI0011AE6D5C|nr:Ig-like domain-containing protein [Gemmatimonas phototrophica]
MSAPDSSRRPMAAMRRLLLFGAVLAAGTACANQSLPPGGPEDFAPPLVVKITPENKSVTGKPGEVTIRFDEVISETPKGARDLSELVFISPKSGEARVDWDRTSIQIRPAKGWRQNTVYTVQIKPGLQDLYNNALDTALSVVFSTGLPIPETRIKGVAFDWTEGRGLKGAVIEAVSADTSLVYQVVADSAGRYDLRNIPIGPYLLRAYGDRNNNKDLEPLEIWDSLRVTLTGYAEAEFYTFARDTVGLRIQQIEPLDSNRVLKVTFDKPYALDQFFVPDGVRLMRAPDSVRMGASLVQTAPQKKQLDSLNAKRKADSLSAEAAKKDTLSAEQRARRDSLVLVRRADSVAAADRAKREAARQAARLRGGRVAPPDTLPLPKMNRPQVYKEAYITLDSALTPGKTYRLQMTGVISLNSIVKAPARNFTIPKPKVDSIAGDSTAAKRDPGKRDSVKRDTVNRGR